MHITKKQLYLVITILNLLLIPLLWRNFAIWNDELFSLTTISGSFHDIFVTTAADVHPPLYYGLLKVLTDVFAKNPRQTVFIGKLFSCLSLLLLMILSTNILSKRYDENTTFLFLLCLYGTTIISYAIEIRMYALTMLFVTMAYLHANEIRIDHKKKDWIAFTIYSILAAYTHYYAVICLSFVYFYLLYLAIKSKNIKPWILSFAVTCFAYFPWLFVLFGQLQTIHESSTWSLSVLSLIEIAVYPFYTHEFISTLLIALVALFIVIMGLKQKKVEHHFALLCCLNPVYVAVIGILISLLTGKFFAGKYLLPGWPVFWLGIVLLFKESKHSKVILAMIIVLNVFTYGITLHNENEDRKGYAYLSNMISNPTNIVYAEPTLANILDYYEISNNLVQRGLPPMDQNGTYFIAYKATYELYDLAFEYDIVNECQFGGSTVQIIRLK